ncbi:heterokaryon incompatibility protein-domain-containing protein [Paraphoma chrysanthemicola]|uniref:Heterokaryon incompatibility protein-domain-containing protein n=1 Tax=Paraphoma chrysanthemicola TaxID=798071 RepID=A0A8K0VSJ2_9PLEO|nr:heterokaryon incompatibility protein-domain-containing protein [Paraphoma chrysanthemicola]
MSVRAPQIYKYDPLNSRRSIRILELLPGALYAPLLCQLTDYDSAAHTHYEALSYVWGEAIFSKCMYEVPTNTIIPITENLSHALRNLRYRTSIRYLWIDAVCINQKDVEEKGHQVQRMGQIYAEARRVIVWLGGESGREPFGLLKALFEQVVQNREHARVGCDEGKCESLVLACTDSRAMSKLLASEWFKRVWIVQELVLACDVRLQCGCSSIAYDVFETAIKTLWKRHFTETVPEAQKASTTFLYHLDLVYDLLSFREEWRSTQNSQSLYMCCWSLSDKVRKCSDERDRIYAFLGLAREESRIAANYSLTLDEIRLETTWKSLVAGEYDVLYTAVGCDSIVTTPSFVGRMSELEFEAIDLMNRLNRRGFRAGLSRTPNARPIRLGSLGIRGVTVDCVDEVRPVKFRACSNGDRSQVGWTNLEEIYELFVPPEPDAHLSSMWEWMRQKFWQTVILSLRMVEEGEFFTASFNNDSDVDFTDDMLKEQMWLNHPACLWLASTFRTRCFFKTSKGYMGRGPDSTRQGDKVVIFDGAETPFLVREIGGDADTKKYKLVGDCYLQGWMNGKYYGHEIVDEAEWRPSGRLAKWKAKLRSSRDTPVLRSEEFVIC